MWNIKYLPAAGKHLQPDTYDLSQKKQLLSF